MVGLVGLGADGVEVKGDAERRADLILAAVTLADGAGLVVIAHELLAELLIQLERGAGEDLLLAERENGALERGERRVQMQHGAHVVIALLILPDDLFIIRVAQNGEDGTLNAEGRLDNIGDVMLVLILIVIGQILTGDGLVLGQVVVGAVGNAPELAPAEREEELEVRRCLGVEAQLLGIVVAQAEVLVLQADGEQPVVAERAPVVEPLKVSARPCARTAWPRRSGRNSGRYPGASAAIRHRS